MSYIRAGSNPEGLYIFSGGDGYLSVYASHQWPAHNLETCQCMVIPEKDFFAITRRYFNYDSGILYIEDEELRSGDLWAINGFFDADGTKREDLRPKDFADRNKTIYHGVRLSHKDWHVVVYPVTWHYIMESMRNDAYAYLKK